MVSRRTIWRAVPSVDHDRGRAGDGVVVGGHAGRVGPRGRHRQHVAGGQLRQLRLLDQHVAGLTVLARDRVGDLRGCVGAVGHQRLVLGGVQRRPGVVGHAAVDGGIGGAALHLLDRADRVQRDSRSGPRSSGPAPAPTRAAAAPGRPSPRPPPARSRSPRWRCPAPAHRSCAQPRARRRGRAPPARPDRSVDQVGQPPDRRGRSQVANLRAQMHVQAGRRQMLEGGGPVERVQGVCRRRSRTWSRCGRSTIFWWVSAVMPGVTRTSTRCTTPWAAAIRSSWSSSPGWSSTTKPQPTRTAAAKSASDLLFPCTITDAGSAPAASAAASSPSEATSAPTPLSQHLTQHRHGRVGLAGKHRPRSPRVGIQRIDICPRASSQ